jgi:alcohol dehydrogenase class IV
MKEILPNQQLIMGNSSCEEILQILLDHKVRRFLLVCGSSFHSLAIADTIKGFPIPYTVFSDFSPNPKYEDICKGVALFNREGCDFVLSVGGGSSMDVAKCIKLFATMDPKELFLRQAYLENGIPLMAIPTTAGTGSESTRYAVIYHEGEKLSVTHGSLVPKFAVLEPSVLESLPLYQKKCSMLDALCQGIESWWSVNANQESISYARQAISLVVEHIDGYLANEPVGNEGMLLASNWAGRAINITQTTAPHAMSYKITSLFGLPHGHAVALCLPKVWRFMLENQALCIDPRGREYLASVFDELATALGAQGPDKAILWLEALLETLDMKVPTGLDEAKLQVLVDSVNLERLQNSPVKLDALTLRKLYENIFDFLKEG